MTHKIPKICTFQIQIGSVACGDDHTLFSSLGDGYVYGMGSNTEGKLGLKLEMRSVNVPTLVGDLSGVTKVQCGSQHSVALTESGEVYTWGQAFYGQLGLAQR